MERSPTAAPPVAAASAADGDLSAGSSAAAAASPSAGSNDETKQAAAEAAVAEALGAAKCLAILQAALLFEHRHYQFGKTMVFLRNGVEGALLTAVQKHELLISWLQSTARRRIARRRFASSRAAAVGLQAVARRRAAVHEARRRRMLAHRRLAALCLVPYAVRIASTLEARATRWLGARRSAALTCQRLARGGLGRRRARWLRLLASRTQPLLRFRWAIRAHCLVSCAVRRMRSLVVSAREAEAAHSAARAYAAPVLQAGVRGMRARRGLRVRARAARTLQRCHHSHSGARGQARRLAEAVNAVFRAVFADDEDALAASLAAAPELALVRQNRRGQRAGMLHAAAAGGAVRLAPPLVLAMHREAVACGRAPPLPPTPEGADEEEVAESELCAALAHCAALKDAVGRTPLHYAARWGQLPFLRWAVRILTLRPKSPEGHEEGGGLDAIAEGEAEAIDAEVRRAVVGVVLPGGGARQRVLAVLGSLRLRLFPLPPRAGASLDPGSLELTALGKPLFSLACERLLYRKSAERTKRDCIEIVIIRARKGKLQQLQMFEGGSEDVCELYVGSPLESRLWMAALHSPRYLQARGLHLVSAVEGHAQALRQTDLWARWALVNSTDARGEGLLASAVRGVEQGEETERCRLIAWLLDAGAECLPMGVRTPSVAAVNVKRASVSARKSTAAAGRGAADATPGCAHGSVVAAGGALALLCHQAAAAASGCSGGAAALADRTWSEVLKLVLLRAGNKHGPAALQPLRLALKDAYVPLLSPSLPRTAEVLSAVEPKPKPTPRPVLAGPEAGAGAPLAGEIPPIPAPSAASQHRSFLLVDLTRCDLAGSEIDAPAHSMCRHLALSMVHEPTAPAGTRSRSASAASPSAGGTAADGAAAADAAGGAAVASKLKKSRLAPLVSELRTGAPLAAGSSSLWFHRTWTAPYDSAHLWRRS